MAWTVGGISSLMLDFHSGFTCIFSEAEERMTSPRSLLAKSGKLEPNQVRSSDTNRERGMSDLSSRRRWAALPDKFAGRRPPCSYFFSFVTEP